MSAEGNLYNPSLFSPRAATYRHADLALEYLEIVESLRTPTSSGAVKAHLFKLYRPALDRNKDLRDRLGKVHGKPGEAINDFLVIAREMKERMDVSGGSAQRRRFEFTEAATLSLFLRETLLKQTTTQNDRPQFSPTGCKIFRIGALNHMYDHPHHLLPLKKPRHSLQPPLLLRHPGLSMSIPT